MASYKKIWMVLGRNQESSTEVIVGLFDSKEEAKSHIHALEKNLGYNLGQSKACSVMWVKSFPTCFDWKGTLT